MSDLYTGTINEFIDWKTGTNSETNENITDGNAVSGGSIRSLLQDRLKKPFKLYQNTNKGKYQIFSSDYAQSLYEGGDHDDLLLGEFEGPSGYKMKAMLATNEYNYLTKTNNGQAQLIFKWVCINSSDETWQATYTNIKISIVNNGIKIWDYSDGNNNQQNLNNDGDDYQYKYIIDIYNHLQSGTNIVTITLSSDTYGSTATLTATYNVIQFQLTEDMFNNFVPITSNSIQLRPQYTISTDNTTSIQIYIDDSVVYSDVCVTNEQITISKSDLSEGPHLLIMYLTTQIQGTEYRSNVLVKKFVKSYSDVEQNNTILTFSYLFDRNDTSFIENLKNGQVHFTLQQYSKFQLNWGLYNVDSSRIYSSVKFYISDSDSELLNETQIGSFSDINVNIQSESPLLYLPKTSMSNKHIGYVIGNGSFRQIGTTSITEFANASLIKESTSYSFKFDAFGKNNQNDFDWIPTTGIDTDLSNVKTEFKNISFTNNNGWYNDSFRTQGKDYCLNITGLPFSSDVLQNSFTFEIDFYTESIHNNDDVLIDVGGFIKIYPNRASLLDRNGKAIIETNFKSDERIKISFIKYPATDTNSVWSNLFAIVTNGIMERGASSNSRPMAPSDTIKIGGADSGIRVYNIRYYTNNLDWKACYNNWIYDADNKADIISRNSVYFTTGSDKWLGEIDQSKCTSLMDTILIEGDLMQLVNKGEKLGMMVNSLTRLCPTDATKNFTVKNCYIRTHGQSNIEYPVPSFKFWTNKKHKDEDPKPELILEKIPQEFCKGRMQVHTGCIPANKWVLQSNFADSSCCHNATFMRKIQDLWYNAEFMTNGKIEYKLRTPPQLFTSNQTITPLDNGQESDTQYNHGYNASGKLWKDYANDTEFPYVIRNAPNSFPCVLFYRSSTEEPWSFFGQYVFMDDKKSDYTYGERSIYYYSDPSDPFVLCRRNIPMSNKNPDGLRPAGSDKFDNKDNRIWDNSSVVRIEVLDVDGDEVNFIKNAEGCAQSKYYTTWSDDRASRVANTSFELIYPDIDDLTDQEIEDNYGVFLKLQNWIVSTKDDIEKFKSEASSHLDLYKIAAYYVFCMIYGLVDSMNRNAQWKTYDGKHWHIEPWDMDVALGCQNNGGIAYDPPIDRSTPGAGIGIGAFSGINSTLWNNLENWDYWMRTIVPSVAQALYEAGMTYENMVDMFDNDYSTMWPEYIYNKSGEYKYIYSGVKSSYIEPKYLPWMQGSRITHRHWWLSTSMDYWYSKFGRGAFTADHIKIDTNIPPNLGIKVKIKPSQKGFFAYFFQQGGFPEFTVQGYNDDGLIDVEFTINESFSTKKPFYLCGLPNMLELDISDLGSGFAGINLNSKSTLTTLYLGAKHKDGKLSYVNLTTSNFNDFNENVSNLQTLDITGQHNLNVFAIPSTVTNMYCAASSYIQGFTATANVFDNLVLPNSHENRHDNTTQYLGSLILKDVSWNNLTFVNTNNTKDPVSTSYTITNSEGEQETVTRELYTGDYQETEELTIHVLQLLGKTCRGINAENSKNLVLKWINSQHSQSLSSTDKKANLKLENVEWTNVSYKDVQTLSEFYNISSPNIHGKITLSETEEMTTDKLSALQTLFGDQVFTLGSNGLVIDYPLKTSIISAGNPAVYEDGVYKVDEADGNGNGVDIKINYVKFNLQPPSNNLNWELQSQTPSGEWQTTTTNGKPSVTNHSNVSIRSVIDDETETTTYYLRITESDTLVVTEDYTFRLGIRGSGTYVQFVVTPVKQSIEFQIDETSENIKDEISDVLFRDVDSVLTMNLIKGGNSFPVKVEWSITGAVSNYLQINNSDNDKCVISVSQISKTAVIGTLKCMCTYINGYKILTKTLKVEEDLLIINSDYSILLECVQKSLGDNTIENVYQSDLKLITEITFDNVYDYYTKTAELIFKYMLNVQYITIKNSDITSEITDSIFDSENTTKSFQLTLDNITYNYNKITIPQTSNISNITILNCNLGVQISNKTIDVNVYKPVEISLTSMNGSLQITDTSKLQTLLIKNDSNITYVNSAKSKWLSIIPSSGTLTSLTLSNIQSLSVDHYLTEFRNLINNTLTVCDLSNIGSISCYAYHKLMDDLPEEIINALHFSNNDYYCLYNTLGDSSKEMYDAVLEFATNYYPSGFIGSYGIIEEGFTNLELNRYTSLYGTTITLNNVSNVVITAKQSTNGASVTKNFLTEYFKSFKTYNLQTCSCDPNFTSISTDVVLNLGNPSSVNINVGGGTFTIQNPNNVREINISGITGVFTLVNDCFGELLVDIQGTVSGSQSISSDENIIKIQQFLNYVYTGSIVLSGTINATSAYISDTKYTTIMSRCPNLVLNIGKAYEPIDPYMKQLYELNNWVKADDISNTMWDGIIKLCPDYNLIGQVITTSNFEDIIIGGNVYTGNVFKLVHYKIVLPTRTYRVFTPYLHPDIIDAIVSSNSVNSLDNYTANGDNWLGNKAQDPVASKIILDKYTNLSIAEYLQAIQLYPSNQTVEKYQDIILEASASLYDQVYKSSGFDINSILTQLNSNTLGLTYGSLDDGTHSHYKYILCNNRLPAASNIINNITYIPEARYLTQDYTWYLPTIKAFCGDYIPTTVKLTNLSLPAVKYVRPLSFTTNTHSKKANFGSFPNVQVIFVNSPSNWWKWGDWSSNGANKCVIATEFFDEEGSYRLKCAITMSNTNDISTIPNEPVGTSQRKYTNVPLTSSGELDYDAKEKQVIEIMRTYAGESSLAQAVFDHIND